MEEIEHLTEEQLEAGLTEIMESPTEQGLIEALVIRPQENEREYKESVELSPEGGVHGDSWEHANWLKLGDGNPDPRNQVSLMNARIVNLIAQDKDRTCLAGDNILVDLDLSEENLPVGLRLKAGEVVLELTSVPHTGCGKFAKRYGIEAKRFVNSAQGKQHHLRGRYARIIEGGTLKVGDILGKS